MKRLKSLTADRACLALALEGLTALLLLLYSQGISGNDFWWHIKVGEWIVEHRAVPTADIFSWIGQELNLPWTAHEWLSEVIFYELYRLMGEKGIYLLSLLAALGLSGLLLWGCWPQVKENPVPGGLFLLSFGIVARSFCYGRPQLFSFFLLFFTLKLLYGFYRDPTKSSIFLLPVVGCLWSNLHGGSANLSYLLCALFFVVSLLNLQWGRVKVEPLGRRASGILLVVLVLTVLSVLVNPVGRQVLVYPYVNQGDGLMLSVISEWAPPDGKNLANLLFWFAPMALTSVGFFTFEGKVEGIDLAVMATFVYLFLRSGRFIMLWFVAAPFCAFSYLPKCRVKPIKTAVQRGAVLLCGGALLGLAGYGGAKMLRMISSGDMISKVVSQRMIEVVQEEAPQRIFNDYNTGETLIFHNLPVFYDARADLFAAHHLMEDGLELSFLTSMGEEKMGADPDGLIGYYNFDGILTLPTRPLCAYLRSHPEDYQLVAEDETAVYFKLLKP